MTLFITNMIYTFLSEQEWNQSYIVHNKATNLILSLKFIFYFLHFIES